jgi:hypothetical protein
MDGKGCVWWILLQILEMWAFADTEMTTFGEGRQPRVGCAPQEVQERYI